MDVLLLAVVAVACLAAGLLAGWFAHGARVAQRVADTASLQIALTRAQADAEGLRERLDEQAHLHRDLLAQSRADAVARDERERREHTVLTALAPVREALHAMQQKVEGLERDRQEQYGSLAEQLRRAHESDEALRATTESLAGALRSNSTRGVWGETQLRRVVEAAGLTRHVDFDTQATIATDAGTGRPDMVIRLPGGTSIAVDAKVPLDAYLEASAIPGTVVGAEQERRAALMQRHVKAVRAHVDALGRKAYWSGLGAAPEFVICFLPNESLLAAALDVDPALLDYAFQRRVALASPVNLWAVLKTVAYTWTQQDVSAEAQRLFELGNLLYERLSRMAQHTEGLRRAIQRTVDQYNAFAGSLETRVLATARQFPGIDQAKLETAPHPEAIEAVPRPLTAPEFVAGLDELRHRIGEPHEAAEEITRPAVPPA